MGMPSARRRASFVRSRHGDLGDAEPHAVAIGDRGALSLDHLEQPAADGAASDQADAHLANRLDADAVEPRRARPCAARRRTRRRRAASRPAVPDRRGTRRARRRDSSFQSDDCAPAACSSRCSSTCSAQGNSMSPGTPTTIVSAVTLLERCAQRRRRRRQSIRAIDRLAQQQKRLDRETLGEAPAVMVEIFGDRRPIEPGRQLAEARVELVAAAIGEHAELTRAAHAGGDVAVAQAVAHQLALQMARRRAPAIGPQAGRDRDQLARSARDGARQTPRPPCRRGWRRRTSPASCSRSLRATPPADRRARATEIAGIGGRRRTRATSIRCRASTGRAPCGARDRSDRARRAPATTPRGRSSGGAGRRRTETATR